HVPPTVLYTLSLHDALPISIHPYHEHALIFSRRKGRGNVLQQEVDAPPYDRQHRKHPGGVVQARPQTLPVGTLQPAEHVIHTAGDRKSTRLNSSHVKISYAV